VSALTATGTAATVSHGAGAACRWCGRAWGRAGGTHPDGKMPLRLHHCKERFPARWSFPLSAQGYSSSSLFPLVPTCSCTAPRRTAGRTSPTGTTPPCTSSSSSPASWTSSRTPRSSCRLAWIGSRWPWLCSLKVNQMWLPGRGWSRGWGEHWEGHWCAAAPHPRAVLMLGRCCAGGRWRCLRPEVPPCSSPNMNPAMAGCPGCPGAAQGPRDVCFSW